MRTTLFTILTILLCLPFFFTSCKKKDPVHVDDFRDTVIIGNVPPEFNGISTVVINNYVNRLYIDLVGREPIDNELAIDVQYLKDNNLKDSAKEVIIQSLMSKAEYYKRVWEISSTSMLLGLDSFDVAREQQLLAFFRYLDSLNGNTTAIPYWNYEISRLQDLNAAADDYKNGSIDINEFIGRFILNYLYYVEINMGSTNFVLATFENLFARLPTTAELEAAVLMTDGGSAALFLQAGSSRDDFVEITTNYVEFYEGLVRNSFLVFLLRNPTSTEMDTYTQDFINDNDYQALQIEITKSKEYAGF